MRGCWDLMKMETRPLCRMVAEARGSCKHLLTPATLTQEPGLPLTRAQVSVLPGCPHSERVSWFLLLLVKC
jgi:hypothetical protein